MSGPKRQKCKFPMGFQPMMSWKLLWCSNIFSRDSIMQVTLFANIYYFTILYAWSYYYKGWKSHFFKKISEWPRSVLVSQFSSMVRAPSTQTRPEVHGLNPTGDFHTSHMMNIRLTANIHTCHLWYNNISCASVCQGIFSSDQKLFHCRWQFFLPKFFILCQHVCLSTYCSHSPCLDVPNIDSFIFVQWNSFSAWHNFNLYRGDILTRTTDHPAIARSSWNFFL